MLDILERKKQDKSPGTNGFLVRMMELRQGPGIRRTNVESKTIDSSDLGAVDVAGPLLGGLSASEANLRKRINLCLVLP